MRNAAAEMRWKPNVTVAGVVEQSGRFLLVEESTADGVCLNQPAGHLEDGETLLQAVEREVLEETTCRFTPQALIGVYQWREAGGGRTFMRFSFAGTVAAPDSSLDLDHGIERFLWMTRDEIAAASGRYRSPWVLICIDDYLAGRRMPLDLIRTL